MVQRPVMGQPARGRGREIAQPEIMVPHEQGGPPVRRGPLAEVQRRRRSLGNRQPVGDVMPAPVGRADAQRVAGQIGAGQVQIGDRQMLRVGHAERLRHRRMIERRFLLAGLGIDPGEGDALGRFMAIPELVGLPDPVRPGLRVEHAGAHIVGAEAIGAGAQRRVEHGSSSRLS